MENSGLSPIFISIGANLGRRLETMRQAVDLVSSFATIAGRSPVYETKSWGYEDPAKYLNAVIAINTTLSLELVLEQLLNIELQLGRKRVKLNHSNVLYAGRTIDLDILMYGNTVLDTIDLTIPHPQLANRLFVLQPLTDIAPNLKHPLLQKSIDELRIELKSDEVMTVKYPCI